MTAGLESNPIDKESDLWQAVLLRDKDHDGEFVYAVRSTGIYCRPSCPSRKPNIENVRFFAFPDLAQQSGFRPCKRCKPDSSRSTNPDTQFIQGICRYIEAHSEEPITLELLATKFQLSGSHLQKKFKAFVGISPQVYLEACRIQQVKEALHAGDTIATALYDAGFGSSSRLYSKANEHLGMTPKRYKEKGVKQMIHYSITDSPLGKLLVAATEKGVCSIRLGDEADALKTELFTEFSQASISEDTEVLTAWVGSVIKHLEGKEPHLDLPLDVRATAFQKQVWQTLQKVPYGETWSYSDLANALGKPKAVRAVASACARNPVALLVPCHRIIRTDGSMGGYRWGLERKEALLKQERELA